MKPIEISIFGIINWWSIDELAEYNPDYEVS